MTHTPEYYIFRAALDNPITGRSYRMGIVKSIDRGYYRKGDKLDLSKVDKDVQEYQKQFLIHWKRLRDMPLPEQDKDLFAWCESEKQYREQEEALKVQFVNWCVGVKNSDLRTMGWKHGEKNKDRITKQTEKLKFWKSQRTQK